MRREPRFMPESHGPVEGPIQMLLLLKISFKPRPSVLLNPLFAWLVLGHALFVYRFEE
jgi:hypothetical protein